MFLYFLGWWQYDERTNHDLETAYSSGRRIYEVLVAGFLYIIDFDRMIQHRKNDPNRRRRIKRDLASIPKKGVAGLKSTQTCLGESSSLPTNPGSSSSSAQVSSHIENSSSSSHLVRPNNHLSDNQPELTELESLQLLHSDVYQDLHDPLVDEHYPVTRDLSPTYELSNGDDSNLFQTENSALCHFSEPSSSLGDILLGDDNGIDNFYPSIEEISDTEPDYLDVDPFWAQIDGSVDNLTDSLCNLHVNEPDFDYL